jgi:hypothetical protein
VVTHGFTHFTLDLHVTTRAAPVGDGWWQPLASIAEAGLPTLYLKAVSGSRTKGSSCSLIHSSADLGWTAPIICAPIPPPSLNLLHAPTLGAGVERRSARPR